MTIVHCTHGYYSVVFLFTSTSIPVVKESHLYFIRCDNMDGICMELEKNGTHKALNKIKANEWQSTSCCDNPINMPFYIM